MIFSGPGPQGGVPSGDMQALKAQLQALSDEVHGMGQGGMVALPIEQAEVKNLPSDLNAIQTELTSTTTKAGRIAALQQDVAELFQYIEDLQTADDQHSSDDASRFADVGNALIDLQQQLSAMEQTTAAQVSYLSTLQTALQAEANARSNADASLATSVSNEAATRQSTDQTLDGKISAEASARQQADTTLTTNLNSEINARQAADTAEATARANADVSLQNQINTLSAKTGIMGTDIAAVAKQQLQVTGLSLATHRYYRVVGAINSPGGLLITYSLRLNGTNTDRLTILTIPLAGGSTSFVFDIILNQNPAGGLFVAVSLNGAITNVTTVADAASVELVSSSATGIGVNSWMRVNRII